jgi:DNA invertase Pin-like site-specific DNA recombinase
MVRNATYIRVSTDVQETTHQRDPNNDWLDDHDAAERKGPELLCGPHSEFREI